ncbi:MAG TPA: hypothetical protein VG916_07890, partial [Gemmatimonadaceae bacterium]|nr:hypothetical protein [Gemmatimonadaceae bacterium]
AAAGAWAPARAADGSLGLFHGETDIGAPRRAGHTTHDRATGDYLVGGGGGNMWFKADSFHYVWQRVDGDVALAADLAFVTPGGNNHRKGVLMIRQSLDADSAYVDVAVHGDGLTSLQFRETKGDITHEVQSLAQAPRRVRLEKAGDYVHLSLAGDDGVLQPAGCSARVVFKAPFYVGLGVCAHDDEAFETVRFSHVVLGAPSRAVQAVRSTLEYAKVASGDRVCVYHTGGRIEAVAWATDGTLHFREDGRGWRIAPQAGARPEPAEDVASAGPGERASPDGKSIARFTASAGPERSDVLVLTPVGGGAARELVRLFDQGGDCPAPAWSPDSTKLAYVRRVPAQP